MRIERAIERCCKARDQGGRTSCDDRRPGRAERGKYPVGAKTGAATVVSYDAKMIRGARGEAADVCTHGLDGVPSLSLHRSRRTVAGREPILERNSRGYPMRIY